MQAKSTKTTTAGVLAALALILTAISDAILSAEGEWGSTQTSMVIAGIAVGLQGIFSRDDNVTSEGTKREKTKN